MVLINQKFIRYLHAYRYKFNSIITMWDLPGCMPTYDGTMTQIQNFEFEYGFQGHITVIHKKNIIIKIPFRFQDFFKYIRKKAPQESALRQVRELNMLLDLILEDFGQQLRAQHFESLPMHNVDHTFERRWLGLNLHGRFHGDQGKLEDLSSVRRKDNCVLAIPKPDQRVFSFNLQLRRAVLDFEHYELRCGPINTKGRLSVEARENQVSVRIAMELKKCDKVHRLEVTRAEIVKLGKLKVRVTGFGAMGGNSLAKVVFRLVVKKLINERKADVEQRLKTFITRTIQSYTV